MNFQLAKTLPTLTIAITLSACQGGQLAPVFQKAPTSQYRVNKVSQKASAFSSRRHMPGEIIVKFKNGANSQALNQTSRSLGLKRIQAVGGNQSGIHLMKLNQGQSISQTIRSLKSNPNVEFAELNHIVKLPKFKASSLQSQIKKQDVAFPNDNMFAQQYAHKVTDSQRGWQISRGNSNVTVAIVDTGVDLSHPDLAAKLVPGRDIVDNDATPDDGQGHGTHCAGIAAAITNNGVGVAGYAPNVKVMPVRVLDDNGGGTSADVANGIIWAAEHGADVISMSLGGPFPSRTIENAVKLALDKDIVVVAAMGNDGNNTKSFPAAVPGVIAVGATDSQDKLASFSQFGNWISVTAPGVNILSTFPTHPSGMPGVNYGSISGTSMATPAVAGLAALVRSKFPSFNKNQVRQQIEANSDEQGAEGFDNKFGHGRINVFKTLSNAPAQVQRLNSRRIKAFRARRFQ